MTTWCGARTCLLPLVGGLVVFALANRAGAQSGDTLCDAQQSTADTCVIAADSTIPDGSMLTFTAANVRVRSTLTVAFTARCSPDPATPCASDADCTAPARCLRTKQLSIQVAGLLTLDPGAKIFARGMAVAGDVVGPDGGAVTLEAHDVSLAGTVSVSAGGPSSIPAGRAGTIAIDADGTVTLAPSAWLDAATSSGGCGGRIDIGAGARTPATLTADGEIGVDGATIGGAIHLVATDQLTVPGMLLASNTNGDPRSRPPCADTGMSPCPLDAGGGSVRLEAASVLFSGVARARGKEGAGGSVRLQGVRRVTLDSAQAPAISVTGGDADAFCAAGVVILAASAGDATVRQGAIEADGISTGFGSDSGSFSITATGTMQCLAGGTPCASAVDCAPGDACVESGGQVAVAARVSAAGGAGAGNGCFPCDVAGCVPCEIRGTGAVAVSAPVVVGGGKQGGGGKVSLTGGGDLSVGPGAITSEAGDGGTIILTAGSRVGSARDVSGKLTVVNGTQVRAEALQSGRVGGDIEVDACQVTLEPSVLLTVDGGSGGRAGQLEVVAHERLDVQSLATLSALPDGASALVYRVDESIAPDAVLRPTFTLVTDPTLSPCPECGNGVTDPFEDCDGRGTCPPGGVCLPPGNPAECTCAATCGSVAGVQPGEDCDGADLGGASCTSLGFMGGTLACNPDCTFDTSRCTADVCGDGLVGPSEQCDPGGIGGAPPSFAGATCASLGFPGAGSLTCAPDCSAIITVPHCSLTVTQACIAAADCPGGETCAAGCALCGNGFLDPGEECDQGAANSGAGNHCRVDCTLPRCGDATLDFSHCAGAPDAACSTAADCAGGAACVQGEVCDLGTAACVGGTNDGMPCCAEADCPGGDCPGDGCTANRDDIPGCCRCDCSLMPVTCGDCDDGNPCTGDRCDPSTGCVHVPVPDGTSCDDGDACNGEETCRAGVCARGAAPACDDHDRCTVDSCTGAGECRHTPLGFADIDASLAPSLALPACDGQRVPAAIGRLVRKARQLVERAARQRRPPRAERLVRRALARLTKAVRITVRAGQHGLSTDCASAIGGVVGDGLARTACLLRAPLP